MPAYVTLPNMMPSRYLIDGLDEDGDGQADPAVRARVAREVKAEIDTALEKRCAVPFGIPLPAPGNRAGQRAPSSPQSRPMNLAATLSLDASRFTNPLAGAQQALGGMLSGIKNSLALLAALTAGALGVGGAFVGLKAALDMGGELTDLSARTGEAVGKLTVFRQALDDAGVGAGMAGGIINLMQKAMTGVNEEGQPTVKAFEALGVSMDVLKKLSPVEQITTLGAAIGKLGDPAKQTQAAMQIFGRSGGELKQFFADPSAMQTAAYSLGAMPALLEKNAEMFDGVSDSIGRLKGKGLGFFVGVADQLTGSLKPLVDQLDALDFTKSGQQVGAMVAQIGAAFQGGKLGEIVGLSLQAGFAQAANFLIAAMEPASKALGGIIGSVFSVENFNDLFKGFAAIGDFLSATLMSAFAKPISFLQAGIESALEVGSKKSEEAFQAKTQIKVNKDINAWDTERMLAPLQSNGLAQCFFNHLHPSTISTASPLSVKPTHRELRPNPRLSDVIKVCHSFYMVSALRRLFDDR